MWMARPAGKHAMPDYCRGQPWTRGRVGGNRTPLVGLDRGGFDLERLREVAAKPPRIRCPHCLWQPRRGSMWTCLSIGYPEFFEPGCGFSWNTFDTGGVCPGCRHRWRNTSCLACGRWSLHEDWYAAGDDADGP